MAQLDIRAMLTKYPRPYLYYSDNGRWTLYRDKESFEKDDELLSRRKRNALILAEGDSEDREGYLPSIVSALCEALGIETDSA